MLLINLGYIKKRMFLKNSKSAQVWVETVVYTLIGITIIGIVIAVATPAIERYKDEMIIGQTTAVLNDLNEKILDVKDTGTGNRRIIPELRIKKGKMEIDCVNDKIIYTLEETRLQYSEEGQEVKQGDISISTQERGRKYDITMTLSYDDVDLVSNQNNKVLAPAATPYKLSVENNGTSGSKIQVIILDI